MVLLDEPWEGLDPDAASWLSERLADVRTAGGAVIVSSHRIHDLAAICDRCVFLNSGRITNDVDVRTVVPAARVKLLMEVFENSKTR